MAKIINKSHVSSKYELPDQTQKTSEVDSNQSETENMTLSFTKDKSVAKNFGMPGDEILASLLLSNESDAEVSNIRLKETIGTGATFKAGSVKIDGTPQPDMDIVTGLTLPNSIASNASLNITYTLVIDSEPTVQNFALKTNVTYDVDEITDLSEDTEEIVVDISENKISIEKTSDKSAVISGQTLMFQNVIKNTGGLKNTELFFTDPIPEGTTFVPGSVKVDQVQKEDFDPAVGFSLGELDANSQIEVTFEVKVN